MTLLYIITGVALLISVLVSLEKTVNAVKIGLKKFLNILPALISMLIAVSVILYLIPDRTIIRYLGNENLFLGVLAASLLGSVTLMPGFIAFPLSGILLSKGVAYMVLSAFTTTLMMVGVVTYPIEKKYFGVKVTILRNIISLGIAIFVALMTGLYFGEL
ncbi:permease [bacterium]|nr:permease [bacterium]